MWVWQQAQAGNPLADPAGSEIATLCLDAQTTVVALKPLMTRLGGVFTGDRVIAAVTRELEDRN
jgi:hypothetical protein